MKLGLLGFPIDHSLSPRLYKELLGDQLESYDKFSFRSALEIPSLSFFASKLDGLNITSPYKTHFVSQAKIESDLVRDLGIINTISFKNATPEATNTDLIAVDKILSEFQKEYPILNIILLGDGSMAKLTKIVAHAKNIPIRQFSRKSQTAIHELDLRPFHAMGIQNLIINACSRDYIFQGKLSGDEIFWDYNYSFIPHQNNLPSQVKSYIDGQEMLLLQAQAAVHFWSQVK